MKKFWRSGMIDKKVVVEREHKEYINRLEMSIHFLKRELNSVYGMKECSKYGIMSAKEWKEARTKLIADNKESNMDNILDWMAKNLRDHPHYDRYEADIEFEKKTFEDIEEN